MINTIRNSRLSKVIASYMAIQLIVTTVQPSNLFALTGGPSQPEFNSFTPIGTSDMVNLTSGDFNYNIPIMDVGGYPLNLSYDSGITMDQEASWVGLGWNLNIGQINRQVRGLPDDFKGDIVTYENNMKPNKTIGMTFALNTAVAGLEQDNDSGGTEAPSVSINPSLNFALTLQHNNYEGMSATPSLGFGFDIGGVTSVGMNLSANAADGLTTSANVGLSQRLNKKSMLNDIPFNGNISAGTTYNSRQGLTALNVNTSISGPSARNVRNNKINKTFTSSIGGGSQLSFIDQTFTPVKRTQFHNTGFSFDPSVGFEAFLGTAEAGVTAFASKQELVDKTTEERAFGYEFTKEATANDILDFNRENEGIVTKGTKALPSLNYTYDLYSIQGQGIGGQFRPYKGKVGHVFDQYIQDKGSNDVLGFEVELGNAWHGGIDFKHTNTESHTGSWETPGKSIFLNTAEDTNLDYEDTYYALTGDTPIDNDYNLYEVLGKENPVALDITPNNKRQFEKDASNILVEKLFDESASQTDDSESANLPYERRYLNADGVTRNTRKKRNTAIQKITVEEAEIDGFITRHNNLEPHHTNGYKILLPDGSTYIYGEAAVNLEKKERTFSIDGNATRPTEGLVTFSGSDDSVSNNNGVDHYFNGIETPAYAHSYLLTSVLSSDYEDLTGDGPTDDDLGAYTKFHYETKSSNYQWRFPYEDNMASYNPGYYTQTKDQKASYTSGEKELKYATKIETKTHIALIDLRPREDGRAVNHEVTQWYIKSIRLYSKPEYIKHEADISQTGEEDDIANDPVKPIKTAHFTYDYSLGETTDGNQRGLPNHIDQINNSSSSLGNGRLTLKSLYFTYRDSYMGKYTPYKFNYDNFNPTYHFKSYDIWGNYKPYLESQVDINGDDIVINYPLESDMSGSEVNQPLTASDFPFVNQNNKVLQDYLAAAWTLSSIDLPSGGKIELQYESDDYQYVQDRKAMQMYNVVGVSVGVPTSLDDVNQSSNLFNAHHIVIKLPKEQFRKNEDGEPIMPNPEEFIDNYIGEHYNKPIYFNFMLNMTEHSNNAYEYVSGYFTIEESAADPESLLPEKRINVFEQNGSYYAAIPLKHMSDEGSGNSAINPISKAGWYFGRNNLRRFVYGVGDNSPENITFEELFSNIGSSLGTFSEILNGPNDKLRNKGIASKFKPHKSWIRLQHGGQAKLGGGLRVKRIAMYDNWDVMLGHSNTTNTNPNAYSNFYGQDYNYQLDNNGGSSGVATFEPNASRENPFVEPYYNEGEANIAPRDINYTEKPFGKSFFPSPMVTYSRVSVSNLTRSKEGEETDSNGDPMVLQLTKNATGQVVNEFYTSKNFPTITMHTDIDGPLNYKDNLGNVGNAVLEFVTGVKRTKTELTLSQGFSVVTNDMNGKNKSQKVYDERGLLISGVDYKYNTDTTGRLNNYLPVIHEDGQVSKELVGVQYEVITDFRESYNNSVTRGIRTNAATFLIPSIPPFWAFVPSGFYTDIGVSTRYNSTTTTKHVHKSGILLEKVAYDLGASVTTKNIAWDAISGQVLLTETTNEYNDNYYNFNYPAHWMYMGMGQASQNLGIVANFSSVSFSEGQPSESGDEDVSTWYKLDHLNENLTDYFSVGDQVYVYDANGSPQAYDNNISDYRFWISEIKTDEYGNNPRMVLINSIGNYLNPCGDEDNLGNITVKVVRSIKRNLQSASMASVTSMENPINIDANDGIDNTDFNVSSTTSTENNPRIINASAVEYKDFWQAPKERDIDYPSQHLTADGTVEYPYFYRTNPFKYNIKGDWRALRSYAFLTGRTQIDNSTRNSGFFETFKPFYIYNNELGKWEKNNNSIENGEDTWTFASEVTKYTPYGAELENKDALGRYSSAQYGYNFTLPVAVASNSAYRQMGYDGFEDSKIVAGNFVSQDHFVIEPHEFVANSQRISKVTDQEAHTGNYSVEVKPNGSIIKTVPISKSNNESNLLNSLNALDCGELDCPLDSFYPPLSEDGSTIPPIDPDDSLLMFNTIFGRDDVTNIEVSGTIIHDNIDEDGNEFNPNNEDDYIPCEFIPTDSGLGLARNIECDLIPVGCTYWVSIDSYEIGGITYNCEVVIRIGR